MKRAGYLETDRQNPGKDLKGLKAAAGRIREGKSLLVFPEGTKSRRGQVKPSEERLFYLAIEAGVPIVPVSIIGSSEIVTTGSLLARPQGIKVVAEKPVLIKRYAAKNCQALMKKVRNAIIANCNAYRETAATDIAHSRPEMNLVD